MAGSRIKGITVEIGGNTTKLQSDLKGGPIATEIGLPGQAVQFVQQAPSGIGFSVHDDCFELPFVGHRNRSVVHQVRIDDQIHTALRKEQPDMFL